MSEAKQRTCLGCKQKFNKDNLVRIVKNDTGIYFDKTNHQSGRGAYICANAGCLEKCIKSRALNRTFKCNVPESSISEIKGEFLANKQN